jgi:hypothetical protein
MPMSLSLVAVVRHVRRDWKALTPLPLVDHIVLAAAWTRPAGHAACDCRCLGRLFPAHGAADEADGHHGLVKRIRRGWLFVVLPPPPFPLTMSGLVSAAGPYI